MVVLLSATLVRALLHGNTSGVNLKCLSHLIICEYFSLIPGIAEVREYLVDVSLKSTQAYLIIPHLVEST